MSLRRLSGRLTQTTILYLPLIGAISCFRIRYKQSSSQSMYWGDLNILPRPIRQSLLVLGGRGITISTITFSVNRQIRAKIDYNGWLVSAMRRA